MLTTRLLLIRHAHTDATSRLCGSFDVDLSPTGHAQVEALLQRRARYTPAALYTSPLRRARHLAQVLGRVWGLEPHPIDAAREIDCGRVEGLHLADLQRNHPELWAMNCAQSDENFAWPDGETYREFRLRVLKGLGVIAAAHQGERVAVVTHAGVISQVLGSVRGRTPAIWGVDRPNPLTATEVTWANGSPVAVLTYNEEDWF